MPVDESVCEVDDFRPNVLVFGFWVEAFGGSVFRVCRDEEEDIENCR